MAGVEGRAIVVTGAGNGLGREYARLLARRGARVVVNDLGAARDGSGSDRATADEVVADITAAGGEAVADHGSVATPEGGAAIVGTALDAFGRIDGVVANAGILRDRSFHKMSAADFDAVVRVHLYGTYHVVHAAWPHLREQGYGRVVVATSTSGLYGNFGQANYAAAKLGMVGLVNTLAIEGARANIRCNAIAPLAATRMTADVMDPATLAQLEPGFVAPVVVQLMGEELQETGLVYVAGGGVVQAVRYFATPGTRFDRVPTVDEVAAAWPSINDWTGAQPGAWPEI